jgi:transcriptional regulator
MERRIDILPGTLDLMILRTLAALGPQHGYSIAARLEQIGEGALQINMGTLYPALVRLEQRNLIRGNWNTTENNRRARFYELTAAGRKRMEAERADWLQMATIMAKVLSEEI